jgi:hypothetical protein
MYYDLESGVSIPLLVGLKEHHLYLLRKKKYVSIPLLVGLKVSTIRNINTYLKVSIPLLVGLKVNMNEYADSCGKSFNSTIGRIKGKTENGNRRRKTGLNSDIGRIKGHSGKDIASLETGFQFHYWSD